MIISIKGSRSATGRPELKFNKRRIKQNEKHQNNFEVLRPTRERTRSNSRQQSGGI